MPDFYEALDFCAFDIEKAGAMMCNDAKPLREVVNDILEEAGLDVAKVEPEPAGPYHR